MTWVWTSFTSAMWGGIGTLDGIEACALDDGTVVAIADINPSSMIVNPAPALGVSHD